MSLELAGIVAAVAPGANIPISSTRAQRKRLAFFHLFIRFSYPTTHWVRQKCYNHLISPRPSIPIYARCATKKARVVLSLVYQRLELPVDVVPLPHADIGDEVLLAPRPQLAVRQVLHLLVISVPQLQEAKEVGTDAGTVRVSDINPGPAEKTLLGSL